MHSTTAHSNAIPAELLCELSGSVASNSHYYLSYPFSGCFNRVIYEIATKIELAHEITAGAN